MKFTEERLRYGRSYHKGRKNGVKFTVGMDGAMWYVVAEHIKNDTSFNSLWKNIRFKTLEQAQKWCEEFKAEDYNL